MASSSATNMRTWSSRDQPHFGVVDVMNDAMCNDFWTITFAFASLRIVHGSYGRKLILRRMEDVPLQDSQPWSDRRSDSRPSRQHAGSCFTYSSKQQSLAGERCVHLLRSSAASTIFTLPLLVLQDKLQALGAGHGGETQTPDQNSV